MKSFNTGEVLAVEVLVCEEDNIVSFYSYVYVSGLPIQGVRASIWVEVNQKVRGDCHITNVLHCSVLIEGLCAEELVDRLVINLNIIEIICNLVDVVDAICSVLSLAVITQVNHKVETCAKALITLYVRVVLQSIELSERYVGTLPICGR